MRVEVTLLLTFSENAPDGEKPFWLELSPDTTVDQFLAPLAIPPSAAKVILVNGRASTGGRELRNGDRLTVFPPLEGG